MTVNVSTLGNYLYYLEASFLVRCIKRYDLKGKKILEGIRETIIANHFYFCYKEDITLTHDKRFTQPNKAT